MRKIIVPYVIQMIIQENVSIEQIRAFKPKTIYYGANTCWWTHDPAHLTMKGVPVDPVGGVLFETNAINAFFQAALSKPEHYGKHGLRAFIAAHHSNCFIQEPGTRFSMPRLKHFASADWSDYNNAIDRFDEKKENQND